MYTNTLSKTSSFVHPCLLTKNISKKNLDYSKLNAVSSFYDDYRLGMARVFLINVRILGNRLTVFWDLTICGNISADFI